MTTILELGVELTARRAQGQPGVTLFLGAGASLSSDVPGWHELSSTICAEVGLAASDDPIETFEAYLSASSPTHPQRGWLLRSRLVGHTPSIGYGHIAQLAADGFIRFVLTTNWDHLTEKALYDRLPPEDVKVLVRGEMPDDVIAETLRRDLAAVYVIKLHGDAASGVYLMRPDETLRFTPALREALAHVVQPHCILVGQSARDVDVLSLLLADRPGGILTVVRPDREPASEIDRLLTRAGARWVSGGAPAVQLSNTIVPIGEFDTFFTQLDLAIRQRLLSTPSAVRRLSKVEETLLTKERRGSGYINHARSMDMLTRFWSHVRALAPEVILFVDDPIAPGGVELRRRVPPSDIPCPSYVIRVEGAGGRRTHERRVISSPPEGVDRGAVRKVLVIDHIAFSGRTLELCTRAAAGWFPFASITAGALVVSQWLHDRLHDQTWSKGLVFEEVTDRFEIFFPWGVTQLTSSLERHFPVLDETTDKAVFIERRPWGALERFADDDRVSVRLLTIEAGSRLSFQRHFCRDELFVALDDNIGLDICSDALADGLHSYDPRVKSIILEKGDYILVPSGIWHRTKAPMERVRLLEIAFGLYDQRNDLQRLADDFGRVGMDGLA